MEKSWTSRRQFDKKRIYQIVTEFECHIFGANYFSKLYNENNKMALVINLANGLNGTLANVSSDLITTTEVVQGGAGGGSKIQGTINKVGSKSECIMLHGFGWRRS